jgi:hypothetical protein
MEVEGCLPLDFQVREPSSPCRSTSPFFLCKILENNLSQNFKWPEIGEKNHCFFKIIKSPYFYAYIAEIYFLFSLEFVTPCKVDWIRYILLAYHGWVGGSLAYIMVFPSKSGPHHLWIFTSSILIPSLLQHLVQ